MADHSRITRTLGHLNGGKSFGQGTNLVDLDEDGIRNTFFNTFLEDFGVRHEQVITHDLYFFRQAVGQNFPSVPITFGHAVFNADDGVFVAPSRQHICPLFGSQLQAFAF